MPSDKLVKPSSYKSLVLTTKSSLPICPSVMPVGSSRFLGPLNSKILSQRATRTMQQLIESYPPTKNAHSLPPFRRRITVREYLESGRINDGFVATTLGARLVTKFSYPTEVQETYEEVENEAFIYHHHLTALQGTVVPKWYGVWVSHQLHKGVYVEILCTVLENVGKPLDEATIHSLSVKEKNAIVHKYRQLHAAGIIHQSAKPKHWLRCGTGPLTIDNLRLIDFGLSLCSDRYEFAAEAKAEIENVCWTLGLSESDLEACT